LKRKGRSWGKGPKGIWKQPDRETQLRKGRRLVSSAFLEKVMRKRGDFRKKIKKEKPCWGKRGQSRTQKEGGFSIRKKTREKGKGVRGAGWLKKIKGGSSDR